MARQEVETAPIGTEEESTVEVKCAHYWLIEPATGPTSMGICKLCGTQKEFSNQFRRNGLSGGAPSSPEQNSEEAQSGE
jgi:hypothetical protein